MSWWRTAYVGQKVVCVRLASRCSMATSFKQPLEVGLAYQIDGLDIRDFMGRTDGVAIHLQGVRGYFSPDLFRPVQPKSTETGMAMIRKILDRGSVKETA